MVDFSKLREERKKQNISQKEMAYKCNICQSYLSEIERCKKQPSFYILKKICQALGKDIEFRLTEKI